jgi:hypothetical protein
MPRLPGGIKKFQRIQAVRDVLARWGKLNKRQLTEHVAAALGCPAAELDRVLYRDLEELENAGAIVALHFTRDGAKIDDYDPKIHKTSYSEWAVHGHEGAVIGASRLAEHQIRLIVPARLRREVMVSVSKGDPPPDSLNVLFKENGRPFCLTFSHEALPLTLVVGRWREESVEIESELETRFGKRACALLVRDSGVSSFKGKEQPGHFTITAARPGQVTITDLKPKNGTFFEELGALQFRSLLQGFTLKQEATVSNQDLRPDARTLATLASGGTEELKLPLRLRASLAFDLLIC